LLFMELNLSQISRNRYTRPKMDNTEDEDSMFLRNVVIYRRVYTVPKIREKRQNKFRSVQNGVLLNVKAHDTQLPLCIIEFTYTGVYSAINMTVFKFGNISFLQSRN
jgi:hypothetical protein